MAGLLDFSRHGNGGVFPVNLPIFAHLCCFFGLFNFFLSLCPLSPVLHIVFPELSRFYTWQGPCCHGGFDATAWIYFYDVYIGNACFLPEKTKMWLCNQPKRLNIRMMWRKKNVSFIQIKIPICVPSSRTGYCEPVNGMNIVEFWNSRMLISVCVFPASSCSAIKVSGPITWLGALILNLELFSQHHNSAVSKIPRHGKLLSVSSVNNWKHTFSKSLKACHSF